MNPFEPVNSRSPEGGSPSAVLCVDDEPEVLTALGRILRREPYQLLRAAGGREALTLLGQFPVKVLVTDERMPGMTGSELLARVRETWPDVKCITLTGYPGPTLLIRSIQESGELVMCKPWDDEALRQAIRRLIAEVDRATSFEEGRIQDSWREWGGEGG